MGKSAVDLALLSKAEQLLKPSGLTLNQVAVLNLLAQEDGLSSSHIAQALDLAPATVTRCTDKLVALHMVRASLDASDLRRNIFRMEVRGQAVLFEIRKSLAEAGSLEEALAAHRAVTQAQARSSLSPAAVRALWGLADGSCVVGELEKRTGLRQSTVSTALASLCAENLACCEERAADQPSRDSRRRCYALTKQGRSLAKKLTKATVNNRK